MSDGRGGTLWYFAYGSNLETATFCGRRGIVFQHAVPVRAPGWRLVFDKPTVLPTGHSVANIVLEPAAHALGVAYEVSEEDLAHVEFTEGVGFGNYRRVSLTVEPLRPGRLRGPATAVSLTSDHRDAALCPSHRYMGMVIAGAIEHGLPAEHLAFLRAVPTREESPEAIALRPVVDEALRRRP